MNAVQWEVDRAHTDIQFKAKHLMITTVTGHFRKYNLEVETNGEDFTKASKIIFTADINSIDTNNAQRDAHLRSEDFFNAKKFPELKFIGNRFEKLGDHYELHGDLTIRDTSKSMTLTVKFSGVIIDQNGQPRAGFTIDGKLSRKEFGLRWNAITEAGQLVVSDEIKMHCEIELVKQKGEEYAEEENEEHAVA